MKAYTAPTVVKKTPPAKSTWSKPLSSAPCGTVPYGTLDFGSLQDPNAIGHIDTLFDISEGGIAFMTALKTNKTRSYMFDNDKLHNMGEFEVFYTTGGFDMSISPCPGSFSVPDECKTIGSLAGYGVRWSKDGQPFVQTFAPLTLTVTYPTCNIGTNRNLYLNLRPPSNSTIGSSIQMRSVLIGAPSSGASGGTTTTTPAPAFPVTTPPSEVTPSEAFEIMKQKALDEKVNPENDYSLIVSCIANPKHPLCLNTDLNGDEKTDFADLSLFSEQGHLFDVNQNETIELQNAPTPASCFFKTSTANIAAMLPYENWVSDSDGFWNMNNSCGAAVAGGWMDGWFSGVSSYRVPPTVACNGATWIKASALGRQCAVDSGFMNMPFGFAQGGGSQFSKFQSLIKNSSSGSAVNLTSLFSSIFFPNFYSGYDAPTNQYVETDLGKLTYATISGYDLNNDGIADFGTNSADIAVFYGCNGGAVSGICAQADFNQDGTIDNRDLALVNFMRTYVFAGSGFIPLGWKLNWFESMFFDPTGYTDKQIISYCMGRKAFEKCGVADVNGDQIINNTDLVSFSNGAPLLDFNDDGKVDLK
ncbi:MAG TPA: hypothetical protein DCS20_03490 [Candidatus Yonathbacteria bacterium]|nr:hypothetical protein [Candidatus Yonathbacteria bacterium]